MDVIVSKAIDQRLSRIQESAELYNVRLPPGGGARLFRSLHCVPNTTANTRSTRKVLKAEEPDNYDCIPVQSLAERIIGWIADRLE